MLEIICCRKGVDWELPEEEAVLDEWVYHCFENGESGKLVGDHEEIDMQQFERMIKVGLWCIQYEPSLRPSIKMVLHMMEGSVDVPIPPNFFTDSFASESATTLVLLAFHSNLQPLFLNKFLQLMIKYLVSHAHGSASDITSFTATCASEAQITLFQFFSTAVSRGP
ncbi:hypothetical protein FNV43_RR18845 [Rhamnella rubrinervis]|uniref:Uncharacterized protein n=1 Tax=Rhamnella rubrinervis TaxID=2594499 RepID=A0A8K0GWF8_9ROSA|nr:hypothetical protein FNV43_RR18845 [Rhamnella rubrinervis]